MAQGFLDLLLDLQQGGVQRGGLCGNFWEVGNMGSAAVCRECTKHRIRLVFYGDAVLHPEHIVHFVHFAPLVFIHAMDVGIHSKGYRIVPQNCRQRFVVHAALQRTGGEGAFTKGGGNVGTPGCVSFMFDNKGQMIVDKEEYTGDADELMMLALDAGADDFNEEEDCYEILTSPEEFDAVNQALADAGVTFASAEVTMIPQTTVDLTSEDDIKKMNRILGLLDEDDDVQNVYHNWNEPEEDEE